MDRNVTATDEYKDKLVKLMPAEVTAAFISINSLVAYDLTGHKIVQWLIPVFAVITYIYMRFAAQITNVPQLLFTAILVFPVWAIAIATHRIDLFVEYRIEYFPAVLVILVTLLVPVFVKK